ncbi:hypothetical protein BDA99DRAFT_533023 [Phascolomyces articulosus]|uniref:F-box domain-containing protein n=1 Tax=Phascolomyces articulosus TaxID=60185 RepID=A0AAD5KR93_9FUNG|nr:hypothetical protein BDA99DRAFT_533023 [Phascolomyces articulosus]
MTNHLDHEKQDYQANKTCLTDQSINLETLPLEIKHRIFSKLTFHDLIKLTVVNQTLRSTILEWPNMFRPYTGFIKGFDIRSLDLVTQLNYYLRDPNENEEQLARSSMDINSLMDFLTGLHCNRIERVVLHISVWSESWFAPFSTMVQNSLTHLSLRCYATPGDETGRTLPIQILTTFPNLTYASFDFYSMSVTTESHMSSARLYNNNLERQEQRAQLYGLLHTHLNGLDINYSLYLDGPYIPTQLLPCLPNLRHIRTYGDIESIELESYRPDITRSKVLDLPSPHTAIAAISASNQKEDYESSGLKYLEFDDFMVPLLLYTIYKELSPILTTHLNKECFNYLTMFTFPCLREYEGTFFYPSRRRRIDNNDNTRIPEKRRAAEDFHLFTKRNAINLQTIKFHNIEITDDILYNFGTLHFLETLHIYHCTGYTKTGLETFKEQYNKKFTEVIRQSPPTSKARQESEARLRELFEQTQQLLSGRIPFPRNH